MVEGGVKKSGKIGDVIYEWPLTGMVTFKAVGTRTGMDLFQGTKVKLGRVHIAVNLYILTKNCCFYRVFLQIKNVIFKVSPELTH